MSEGIPIIFDLNINAIEVFYFMIEVGRVFNHYMDENDNTIHTTLYSSNPTFTQPSSAPSSDTGSSDVVSDDKVSAYEESRKRRSFFF